MPDPVPEATLTKTELGLVAGGEGWFVANAREVTWITSAERGQDTDFEGRSEFSQLGFRIQVIGPGQRGVYHRERGQEDFLVVSGDGPCAIVMVGRRATGFEVVYPVNVVAAKHGASVQEETTKPDEAFAHWGPEQRTSYREGWLP